MFVTAHTFSALPLYTLRDSFIYIVQDSNAKSLSDVVLSNMCNYFNYTYYNVGEKWKSH